MLFKNLHRNSKSCQSRAAALIIAVLLTFGAVLAPAAVFADSLSERRDTVWEQFTAGSFWRNFHEA